jgi:hypothetical protein
MLSTAEEQVEPFSRTIGGVNCRTVFLTRETVRQQPQSNLFKVNKVQYVQSMEKKKKGGITRLSTIQQRDLKARTQSNQEVLTYTSS